MVKLVLGVTSYEIQSYNKQNMNYINLLINYYILGLRQEYKLT